MPRRSAAVLRFNKIPAGFNAPLEFLTGFTFLDVGNGGFIQREAFPKGKRKGAWN